MNAAAQPPYLVDPYLARIPWLIHGFGTRGLDGGRGGGRGPRLCLGIRFRRTQPRLYIAGECPELYRGGDFRREGSSLDIEDFARRQSPPVSIVQLEQTHSDVIRFVEKPMSRKLRGDALATETPGLLLVIRTADCLPVLLVDEARRAVAVVHCGWRGTQQRILERVVAGLLARYGCRPESLRAVLGPCIGSACYEVGEDVRARFSEAGPERSSERDSGDAGMLSRSRVPVPDFSPIPGKPGKFFFDLRAANRRQLLARGLRPEFIFDIPLCTHCEPGLLSYRRDRDTSARLYNFIGLTRS